MNKINIFWFRRDLRLHDNAGLYHSLKNGKTLPIFIFDTTILSKLDNSDARVEFILQSVLKLKQKLESLGSSLQIYIGEPEKVFYSIIKDYTVNEVYSNTDYEPKARLRDKKIEILLKNHSIKFHSFKDQVIFEKNEILTDSQTVYHVYSAFAKKWLSKLNSFYIKSYPNKKYFSSFISVNPLPNITLNDLGFSSSKITFPSRQINADLIQSYGQNRDFPAIEGTSKFGLHLRFGTVSIRELVYIGQSLNAVWLSELIWRDFFMYLLFHYPETETRCFKPEYDNIIWENNPEYIQAWKEGKTGVPLVDAGMRELNSTGYMHNRVRMIVASYLCKNLRVDWKIGERYFAQKLLDFDLSANIGNWQWVAGCGCDAAPYFRVFNPYLQAEKFDPDSLYIKKWVPEYQDLNYKPIVDFKSSRLLGLAMYDKILKAEK